MAVGDRIVTYGIEVEMSWKRAEYDLEEESAVAGLDLSSSPSIHPTIPFINDGLVANWHISTQSPCHPLAGKK